ncbi:MAG: GlsB/YeaQ/YmgE family stress response membrane protein [Verrucomicrobiota bacterium]|nr:GlsB/YeaQ/YmgE family stress response membrane protein [Verrucomicrobiota bacterium]
MLHIIWSIIVGAIIGGIAELLVPGRQHLGFWKSALLGIAGSIIGGLIGRLFSKPQPGTSFHPAGFIMSIICAILLLILWGRMHPV